MEDVGKGMQNGDTVVLSMEEGACPEDKVEICLQLCCGVSWYKCIKVGNTVVVERQDTQDPTTGTVSLSSIMNETFSLWKGKTFDFHTDIYHITDARTKMKGGNRYRFRWEQESLD